VRVIANKRKQGVIGEGDGHETSAILTPECFAQLSAIVLNNLYDWHKARGSSIRSAAGPCSVSLSADQPTSALTIALRGEGPVQR
jgi:hypothetical protein